MPIYLRLLSGLLLSMGLLLSGYRPRAEPSASWHDPLGKRWVLRTLDGATVPPALGAPDATARLFQGTIGALPPRAVGRGYSGTFTHSFGSRLRALAQVITTLMKSDDAALNLELHYLTALEQSTHYTVAGSTLSLFDQAGAAPRATFEAVQ